SSSLANDPCAVPWLATSRTITGRVLTFRLTRMRPTADELSGRNSAGSSRFPKSVACITATSGARPEPSPPPGPPAVRRSPSHVPPPSVVDPTNRNWPTALHRTLSQSLRLSIGLSPEQSAVVIELDEVLMA